MDQKPLCNPNVLKHELYFLSQMLLSRLKNGVPSSYISSQSYYNKQQIRSVFMNVIHIFGVITKYLTSTDTQISQAYFPDYALLWYFSFFVVSFVSMSTNISLLPFFNIFPEKHLCLTCQVYHSFFLYGFFSSTTPKISQRWKM